MPAMPLIVRADGGMHCLFRQMVAHQLRLQPTRLEEIAPRQLYLVPQADIRITRVGISESSGLPSPVERWRGSQMFVSRAIPCWPGGMKVQVDRTRAIKLTDG